MLPQSQLLQLPAACLPSTQPGASPIPASPSRGRWANSGGPPPLLRKIEKLYLVVRLEYIVVTEAAPGPAHRSQSRFLLQLPVKYNMQPHAGACTVVPGASPWFARPGWVMVPTVQKGKPSAFRFQRSGTRLGKVCPMGRIQSWPSAVNQVHAQVARGRLRACCNGREWGCGRDDLACAAENSYCLALSRGSLQAPGAESQGRWQDENENLRDFPPPLGGWVASGPGSAIAALEPGVTSVKSRE